MLRAYVARRNTNEAVLRRASEALDPKEPNRNIQRCSDMYWQQREILFGRVLRLLPEDPMCQVTA